jgi:hypothetical protein
MGAEWPSFRLGSIWLRGGPTYWVWGPSGGAFDYPSPTGEAQWAGGVIRRPKRRRRVRGRAGYIGLDLHIDLDR